MFWIYYEFKCANGIFIPKYKCIVFAIGDGGILQSALKEQKIYYLDSKVNFFLNLYIVPSPFYKMPYNLMKKKDIFVNYLYKKKGNAIAFQFTKNYIL